ncbi:MAG: TatD family hydrolase [Bacilli bacterium]|nr:TatD family hydrolase [Bacilli bacterium]
MYIDTHCHLTSEDYDDIDLVIKENIDNNVSKIIVSGCDMGSIKEGLILSTKYPSVYLTLGFHPSEVNNYDLNYLKEALKEPKVVGLGEIGLDYHYGKEDIDKQKDLFRKQLDIATKLNIPVVIHSRDATKDTINILKEYNLKGVIHCFSGSLETAKEYIKMGYLLGIGGVVTFKNSKLYKVVEGVSLENIVLETDSPYLTPEPDRGKKNSSKYIPIIAKKVSEIKKISEEKVMKTTTDNATKLFDLK